MVCEANQRDVRVVIEKAVVFHARFTSVSCVTNHAVAIEDELHDSLFHCHSCRFRIPLVKIHVSCFF